jgi:Na+/proline symporter
LSFLLVGILSIKNKKKNLNDYYIADRSMSPLFVGLSGAATLLNGIMFFGNIGMTYLLGFKFGWFYIGAIIAHIICFSYFAEKFATSGHKNNNTTLLNFLSNNSDNNYKYFTIIAALFIIIFSSVVAASQLLAGAKTLNYFFDVNFNLGGATVLIIVLMYCYAGGIRASIWTDVAQTFVMMIAMGTLSIFCLNEVGGWEVLTNKLSNIDNKLTTLFFSNNMGGWLTFGIGWLFMFLGTAVGSPQIAVRYLTIKDPKETKKAGVYYTTYIAFFYGFAFIIGLCARALIPIEAFIDKEFGLIILANQLLPEILIGVVIAGIFASLISTTDSLVLVASSSITKDIFPKANKYYHGKIFTTLSCGLIYLIFLFGGKSVFSLLVMGYSSIASIFFPLVTLHLLKKSPNQIQSILMMIISLIVIITWRYFNLHTTINECAIAIPTSLITYGLSNIFIKKEATQIEWRDVC